MESDGVIGEPVPLRAASAQETAAAEQLERWYARALELALGGEAILLGEHTATLQSFIDEHPGYFNELLESELPASCWREASRGNRRRRRVLGLLAKARSTRRARSLTGG